MTAKCPTEIAPMPWMLKKGESWTQQTRDEEAAVLEKVRGLDARAVAHIREAVASL